MSSMKWTPDNDRMLLIKILETHQFSINYERIRNAWPKDAATIPSARAIQERLQKIRKQANENAAATGVQPIQAKFLTPRAPRRRKAPSSSAKKRKTKKAAPSSESSDAEDHLTPSDDDSPTKAAKTRAVKTPGSAVRTGGSFITKLKTPGKEVGAASDKVQAIGDSIQIADTVQASRANLQAPGANIKSRGPAVKIPREHFGTFKLTAPRNPVEATGADFSFFDVHNPDANHKDANAEHNAATNDGMGSTDASSAVNAGSPITTTKPVANKRVHGGAFEGPSALLSTQTLRDTGKTNVMGTEANAMQGPMTVTMPVSMPETMDNTVMNINMPTTLNHSASFQDFGFGVGNNMGGSFGNGSFTNPSFDSSGYAGDIDSNFFGSFEPNMTSGIAGEVGAGNLMNGNGFDLDISGDDNSFVDYNAYQGGYMHQPANFLGNNGLTGASTFEGGSVFSSGAGHARASTINDASGSAFENSKEAMLNKQFQTSININPKAKGRNVPVCYGEDAIEVREETMRGRSARAASHKASEGVAAFIKREKEHAKEDGERTSEEDSAESMFTGDGDEDFA